MSHFLEFIDVGKIYPGKSEQVEALRGINFSCGAGDFICLLGRSGCGKSTLLQLVAGLEQSTSGQMIVAGRDIEASHSEVVADVKTGLQVGEIIRMRGFDYTVVGLTKNMVGFNADPVIYARLVDAQNILFEPDPDLLRNIRRRTGGQVGGAAAVAPRLTQPLARQASAVSENLHMINAIAVRVEPGVPIEEVANEILGTFSG